MQYGSPVSVCSSDLHMASKAVFLNVHITYVLNKQANDSFALESM